MIKLKNIMKPYNTTLLIVIIYSFLLAAILNAQSSSKGEEYLWLEEKNTGLQIIVHIWGEIKNPGQYVVPDGTTVLELISLAGGPNEFSNLTNVRLTREYYDNGPNLYNQSPDSINIPKKKEIYKVNLKKHLNNTEFVYVHELKPGDVVTVAHNNWFKFQTILKIITQVAIIGQAYYYFTRSL